MPDSRQDAAAGRGPELDLVGWLRLLWRRALLILGVVVLGTAGAAIAIAYLPRQYVAEALLLIEPRPALGGRDGAVNAGLDRDSATIDSQVQVLRSRSLARRVIVRLGLDADPELRGGKGEAAVPPAGEDEVEPALVEAFLGRLDVVRRGKTRVIAVAYRSADPNKAARVANAVAELYVADQLSSKFELSRRAASWLASRLKELEDQVAQAERELLAFRTRAREREQGFLARARNELAGLERAHVLARSERLALEARLERIKRNGAQGLRGVLVGEASPLLASLESLRAELVRREAELLGRYGERHPAVQNLRREKAELDRQIRAERAALLVRVEAEVEQARVREQALARELERLKRAAQLALEAEVREQELARRVEVARGLYEAFLRRLQDAAGREEIELADVRVISEAQPPTAPEFPDPLVWLSFSGAGSFLLALFAAYLLEQSGRGFRSAEALARFLGGVETVVLPRLRRRQLAGRDPADYAIERPRSRYSEGLRELLALALRKPRAEEGGVVWLVASALPAEGKSSLALALGRLAAAEGFRAAVLDLDLRRAELQSRLGLQGGPGIAELLEGRARPEEVMRQDPRTPLVLLPAAPALAQPTRLLTRQAFADLLKELRRRFDFIVMDSPPLAAVADARLLAAHADGLVMLVQWAATGRTVLRRALARLGGERRRLEAAVLTMAETPELAYYGYGEASRARRRLAAYYGD